MTRRRVEGPPPAFQFAAYDPLDDRESVVLQEGPAPSPHLRPPRIVEEQREDGVGQHPSVHLLHDVAVGGKHRFLVQHAGAAATRHDPGVHHLVVAREVGLRDHDCGQAQRGQLVEAPGAAAGDHEVRDRVDVLDLVEGTAG